MKSNMGIADRVIRLIAAVVLVVLYFTNVITGTWGIIILVVAGLFVLTSFCKLCPVYLPFGIKTCKNKE